MVEVEHKLSDSKRFVNTMRKETHYEYAKLRWQVTPTVVKQRYLMLDWLQSVCLKSRALWSKRKKVTEEI